MMIHIRYTIIFCRWSTVLMSTQLFNDNQQEKHKPKSPKTEPVKKCQRALKFFNTSETSIQRNLFNSKPNKKELTKLHKQV